MKIKKYALYAIGELILVIAGILIALEINNASELRKKQDRIDHIFSSVKQELELNIHELSQDLYITQRIDSSLNYVLEVLGDVNTESLNYHLSGAMGMAIWKANTLALDEMVSTGVLSSIEDQKLKSLINQYRRTIEDVGEHTGFLELQSVALMDYMAKNGLSRNATQNLEFFSAGPSRFEAKTDYYEDPEFENRIVLKFVSINFTMEKYLEALELMEQLSERLNSPLD